MKIHVNNFPVYWNSALEFHEMNMHVLDILCVLVTNELIIPFYRFTVT